MFVEFGTACFPGHSLDFGHLHNEFFGLCANAVTLGKRYTGQGADVDGKRTFVERRQERTAQREEEGQRNHYQYARNGQYAARCLTGGPAEHVQVALLHGGYPAGFLADSIVQFAGRIFQQIAAQG